MRNALDFWNFDKSFANLFGELVTPPFQAETSERFYTPACDLEENETQFMVALDVPGVKRDDMTVEIKENRLFVSGERKNFGKFQRVFTLPPTVNTAAVEAHSEDGVLKIVIPKAETAKPIQIKVGEAKPHTEKH